LRWGRTLKEALKSRDTGFSLGVNYAWVHYGGDFGSNAAWGANGVSNPHTEKEVVDDFARMAAVGVKTVRWFLFCDGRAGILFDRDIPTGLDRYVLKDLDAALEIAQRYNISIAFVLLDYTWMLKEIEEKRAKPQGHAEVLHSAAGQEALLNNILLPLFTRYRGHPNIYSWEVMNEPEWIVEEIAPMPTRQLGKPIKLKEFKAFARKVANAVHTYTSGKATLGSARLKWLGQWTDVDLDYYEVHFYPATESDQPGSCIRKFAEALSQTTLDRPLWLGEFPANDPAVPEYSMQEILDLCWKKELAGACIWKWRKPAKGEEAPEYGTPDISVLKAWSEAHELGPDLLGSVRA
jgi:hypothetical protein